VVIFDYVCRLFLKFQIDDPLSAAPMHGFGGMWGAIITGLLAKQEYVIQVRRRLRQGPRRAAPCAADSSVSSGLAAPARCTGAHRRALDMLQPSLQAYANTNHYGAFYAGGGGRLLACQLIGIITIGGWVVVHAGLLFFLLRKLNMLRIPPEEEQMGLDVSKHGGAAYNYDHGIQLGTRK
jgi:Amt family ammonium transporter